MTFLSVLEFGTVSFVHRMTEKQKSKKLTLEQELMLKNIVNRNSIQSEISIDIQKLKPNQIITKENLIRNKPDDNRILEVVVNI